jgi:hypothetical protein
MIWSILIISDAFHPNIKIHTPIESPCRFDEKNAVFDDFGPKKSVFLKHDFKNRVMGL